MNTYLRKSTLPIMLAATVGLAGCTGLSSTQQSTLSGGAIGATAGAVGGALTGGCVSCGAAIGGAVGAGAGYVLDKEKEDKRRRHRH